MPFNASFVFEPLAAPDYPAVAGTVIASAAYNNVSQDIFDGLTAARGMSSTLASLTIGESTTTQTRSIEVGGGRTGSGISLIDLVGDTTYSDYGLRLRRSAGANAASEILHRGTGTFTIEATEAAAINFNTTATTRFTIGNVALSATLPIREADGTAAAPIYSFTSDADTGIYRLGANQMAIASNGALNSFFVGDRQILGGQTTELNSSFRFQVAADSASGSIYTLRYGANSASDVWAGGKSRGAFGTPGTIVANGDDLLTVRAHADDGVDMSTIAGAIIFEVASAPSANRIPTRIDFQTAAGTADDDISTKVRIVPAGQIHASDGSVALPQYSFLSDNDCGMYRVAANHIAFATGGSAFMGAADNAVTFGNLGDSSHLSFASGTAYLQVNQSSTGRGLSLRKIATNTSSPDLSFVKSRGSLGAETNVVSGDSLGKINFVGHDTNAFGAGTLISAEIEAVATATFASTQVPARLTIRTNDGVAASTPSAAMSIMPGQQVLVGAQASAFSTLNSSGGTPQLQVVNARALNATQRGLGIIEFASGGQNPLLSFARARNDTAGNYTAVTAGLILGEITFEGSDGGDFERGASIRVLASAAGTAGDVPGDFSFSTKTDGGSFTEKLVLTHDGRLYGSALHNNAGVVTGTTNQHIASGIYTATRTLGTNAAAGTVTIDTPWQRVGNVVTLGVQCSIDPTTTGSVVMYLSLPIASNFTTAGDACGCLATVTATLESAAIFADAAGDRLQIQYIATATANTSFFGTAIYTIL